VKAGQEPAASDCGVGVLKGGDTGQSVPATAMDDLVQLLAVWNGAWCGWLLADSTLLGPEGTTRPALR
jgi:hypothetical protein